MAGSKSPEDNDKEKDDFEKYIQDTLFGDRNNPLHPKYEGENSINKKERDKLRQESTGLWDRLVPDDEIEKIARLELALMADNVCPHLKKPYDKESTHFYFCNVRAICLAPDKKKFMIGHPSRKAVKDCEEEAARCDFNELSNYCLRGKYTNCKDYKEKLELDSKSQLEVDKDDSIKENGEE